MAEIAVNFAIEQLVSLTVQETKLLKSVRQEVDIIKAELDIIQPFLREADERAEREEINASYKVWVKQLRKVAYRIEDLVDDYVIQLAQPCRQSGFIGFLLKVAPLLMKLKARHIIASEVQDIKKTLFDIKKSGESYGFNFLEKGSSSGAKNDTWHDPRVAALFIEEAKLVGIESPRDELISWLVNGASKRTTISVVGMGGLGKTTLAKKVYDNNAVIGHFICHAWIPVSQSYKQVDLLRKMIKQLYEEKKEPAPEGIDSLEEVSLIIKLREYLQGKRYVIVFDDVWEIKFWEFIKNALPDDSRGSRIIITTRSDDIASFCKESSSDHLHKIQPLSFEKAFELFCMKAFESDEGGRCPPELVDLSRDIVRKCEGMPLAIVAIGGLLSKKRNKVPFEWKSLLDSLGSELETNPHLSGVKKILLLSYHDLPCHLKSCFLYLGIIPEDFSVSCVKLIRLWIAEGFVEAKRGKTLEDVAEEYLSELIHRSLVQASWVDTYGKVRSCRIHDLMREVLFSKLMELSFCQILAKATNSSCEGQAPRRLSIHHCTTEVLKSSIDSESLIRAVFVFGVDELPVSMSSSLVRNFKLLKVLDFEGAPINCIPEEVGNLYHLRYLSVRSTKIKMLPKSIGKLQNLQTLDLKQTLVYELPVEVTKLHKLRHLLACYEDLEVYYSLTSQQGVKMQDGIGQLVELQKLYFIEANHGGVRLIEELRNLKQLRKLGIKNLTREIGRTLCKSIMEMKHLKCLDVYAIHEDEILDVQSIASPPTSLQRLYLRGRLEKLPDWIPQLHNLVRMQLSYAGLTDDPLKALQALPNLLGLGLSMQAYNGESLYFETGAFRKLKSLSFWDMDRLKSMVIEEEALPLLEMLEIGQCPLLNEPPDGICYLRKLTTLEFYDMPKEFCMTLLNEESPAKQIVEHVPNVFFGFRSERGNFESYTPRELMDSNMFNH